ADILGFPGEATPPLESLVGLQDPQEVAKYVEFRRRAAETRQRAAGEYRWRRPDGQVLWLHAEIEPRFAGDGSLEGFFGACQDVTEQRQAEAENRQLALVAARTNSLVIITDPAHRIEWVNEAFTRITGYTLADAAGRNPHAVLGAPDADPNWVSFVRSRLE